MVIGALVNQDSSDNSSDLSSLSSSTSPPNDWECAG